MLRQQCGINVSIDTLCSEESDPICKIRPDSVKAKFPSHVGKRFQRTRCARFFKLSRQDGDAGATDVLGVRAPNWR